MQHDDLLSNVLEVLDRCTSGGLITYLPDEDFTIQNVNDRLLSYLGYQSAKELRADGGVSLRSLIHPDDWDSVREKVRESLNTGGYYSISYRLREKGGAYIWILSRGKSNLTTESGRTILSVCFHITDEKISREEEIRQYEQVVTNLGNAFYAIYYVNLNTGKYRIVRETKDIRADIRVKENFFDSFRDYAHSLLLPEDRDVMVQQISPDNLQKVLDAENNIFEKEYRRRFQDHYEWVRVQAVLSSMSNGRADNITMAFSNINEEKSQELKQQSDNLIYSYAISSVYDNIIELDLEEGGVYSLEFGSKGLEKEKWEQSITEAVQYRSVHMTHPDDADSYLSFFSSENMQSLLNNETNELYLQARRLTESGEYQWHSFTLRRFSEQEGSFIILFIKNIHETVVREKEAQDQITRALREAEAASLAKTDFLSHMSHEIRTPLGGIIGMLSLIRSSEDLLQIKQYVKKALTSSEQLLHIINDILDMSKIESGEIELEREAVSIREIIDSILAIVEPMANAKNITLTFRNESGPDSSNWSFYTDRKRLLQIRLNLLSNAIKYTKPGGSVTVIYEAERTGDGRMHLRQTVRDTGIGMSREFLDKIFEPFSQENTSSTRTGTGLGLAITKELVSMMGGTIEIESRPGEGTTIVTEFFFDLARSAPAVQSMADADYPGEPDFSGCRVLLVEDNELNLEIAEIMLTSRKLEVYKALNGVEAVEMFTKSPVGFYDIIFMDIMMPFMDGFEATKTIRSLDRPDAASIPIVAMTANAFVEDVKKTMDNGMNYHISKPFMEKDLVQALDIFVKK